MVYLKRLNVSVQLKILILFSGHVIISLKFWRKSYSFRKPTKKERIVYGEVDNCRVKPEVETLSHNLVKYVVQINAILQWF